MYMKPLASANAASIAMHADCGVAGADASACPACGWVSATGIPLPCMLCTVVVGPMSMLPAGLVCSCTPSLTLWLPACSHRHCPQAACQHGTPWVCPSGSSWSLKHADIICINGTWASCADQPSASYAPAPPQLKMSLNPGLITRLERHAFKDRTGRRATVGPAMPAATPLAQRMSQTCTLPSLDPAASLQRSATSGVSRAVQVHTSYSACTSSTLLRFADRQALGDGQPARASILAPRFRNSFRGT